jgi:hypothetical protein
VPLRNFGIRANKSKRAFEPCIPLKPAALARLQSSLQAAQNQENCTIFSRKPLPEQKISKSAQHFTVSSKHCMWYTDCVRARKELRFLSLRFWSFGLFGLFGLFGFWAFLIFLAFLSFCCVRAKTSV